MGGKNVCENVCDKCNSYFGNYNNGLPPIETVLKETFNISRARFLQANNEIGKNKTLPKFSSIYYKVDFRNNKLSLKSAYKYHFGFQEKISRQLKKGLYKIYLEEIERQRNSGHLPRYDFIREFARYDLGDYPLIYFRRRFGIFPMADEWLKTPELFLNDNEKFKYLIEEDSFFEFELLGHVFGIATSKNWQYSFDSYVKKTTKAKENLFNFVNKFNDIDLGLSILDRDEKRSIQLTKNK